MTDLVLAQAGRFAAIDPLLPLPARPAGETLVATLPDGRQVAGVLRVTTAEPDAPATRRSARESWELTPLTAATGIAGMDAVLRALRARLDRWRPPADSSCVVMWPSRDAGATGVFLRHGLRPRSVLAVRTATGPPSATAPRDDVRVRRAEPADLEALSPLEPGEFEYSAHVGGAPVGVVGMDLTHVPEETEPGALLPAGRWGCVRHLSVLPSARGHGVGRTLAAVAHAALDREGVRGTYLYYEPPDPRSPVFWHRQGYRPLWTVWEIRPASMLR